MRSPSSQASRPARLLFSSTLLSALVFVASALVAAPALAQADKKAPKEEAPKIDKSGYTLDTSASSSEIKVQSD